MSFNELGEVEYIPELWTKQYIASGIENEAPSGMFGNWSFDGLSFSKSRDLEGTVILNCLDPIDGSICWQWSDWFNPETEATNGRFYFLRDDILHWKTKTRQYWLDISSGTTIKKYNSDQLFTFKMQVLGDNYFVIGNNVDTVPDHYVGCVYQGTFLDPEPKQVLVPPIDTSYTLGSRASDITSIIPIVHRGDTMLVVAWQQVFPNWEFQSYLGLYNLSTKTWEYNNVVLNEKHWKGVLYQPMVKYERSIIATVHNSLICYDYLTGERIWEKEFPHDFSFSGYEISDDILVASCENETLYGLDPKTGRQLWIGQGAGTSSKLQDRILNGILYFAGGGTGKLHAVDIRTGKTLWKLDPALYEPRRGGWSTIDFNVIAPTGSGKGHIIVKNGLNWFCFEAIQ
jgi:outer membrane protein assembly factor BamB